jgi:hypothetical protein
VSAEGSGSMRRTRHDDDGLRRAFGRLRDEERRAAPGFDQVMSRRQTRRPADGHRVGALRLVGAAAVILLLALGGLRLARFMAPGGDTGALAAELQRTSAVWHSPTDFLLERPAARSWRGIPAIGRSLRPTAPTDPAVRDRIDGLDMEDPGRTPS